MAGLYRELENTDFKCPFCGEIHQNRSFCGPIIFRCLGMFCLDIEECDRELSIRRYNDEQKILAWSKLAHYIAKNYLYYIRKPNTGLLPINFRWVLDNTELPTPAQQADNLISYIADNIKQMGKDIEIEYNSLKGKQIQALIGSVDRNNLVALLLELINNKLIVNTRPQSQASWRGSLTMAGWKRVEELKKVNKQSSQAFMAMKFDDKQQKFIKEILAPSIKKLGFDLKLLPEIASKESLIDNKLRVAIKQSRFLICDLTHGNQGAYWEAGYAEGLGLPVIYICEQKTLDDKTNIHFDVNHQEIYTWKEDDKESIESFLDRVNDKIYLITH